MHSILNFITGKSCLQRFFWWSKHDNPMKPGLDYMGDMQEVQISAT
jgi:hypothetical protein